jgi:hypothetical protein
MIFPPANVMYLLLALYLGQRLTPDAEGRLTITLPPEDEPVVIPSLADGLERLDANGWIDIPEGENASPVLTEQGRYSLRRWMTSVLGRGRLVKNLEWRKVG